MIIGLLSMCSRSVRGTQQHLLHLHILYTKWLILIQTPRRRPIPTNAILNMFPNHGRSSIARAVLLPVNACIFKLPTLRRISRPKPGQKSMDLIMYACHSREYDRTLKCAACCTFHPPQRGITRSSKSCKCAEGLYLSALQQLSWAGVHVNTAANLKTCSSIPRY